MQQSVKSALCCGHLTHFYTFLVANKPLKPEAKLSIEVSEVDYMIAGGCWLVFTYQLVVLGVSDLFWLV